MLGEIKHACNAQTCRAGCETGWRRPDCRPFAAVGCTRRATAPALVLPVDQAEELFNADAGPEAPRFLELLALLVGQRQGDPGMIVAITIRADRYEPLQIAPELATGATVLCSTNSSPCRLPATRRSISGSSPTRHQIGRRLTDEPALVDRLLADTREGADALPLLALTLERLYTTSAATATSLRPSTRRWAAWPRWCSTRSTSCCSADPAQRQAQLDTCTMRSSVAGHHRP